MPNSNDVLIGSYDPSGCALAFNGKIDEVRIWNQALSPAVISALAAKSCNFVTTSVRPGTIAEGGFVTVTGGIQNCTGSYSFTATTLINGFPVTMSSAALNVTP